jgi:tetratricopeptide (TPR) repeat protein
MEHHQKYQWSSGNAAADRTADFRSAVPIKDERHRVSSIEHAAALYAEQRELTEQGRYREALAPATEAFRVLRELPVDVLPSLGADVGNAAATLVNLHLELDQADEAIAVADEAVAFCRTAADGGRSLIFTLHNLCSLLSNLDRPADGVAVGAELVTLLRDVTSDDLEFQPKMLTGTLTNLCLMHDRLGQPAEAVRCGLEVIALLADEVGEQALRRLIQVYDRLLQNLAQLGEIEQAADLTVEAIRTARMFTAVAVTDPLAAQHLVGMLEVCSRALAAAGRTDKALQASARAVRECRIAMNGVPDGDDRLTALTLFTFAEIRADARVNLPAALVAAQESVNLYRLLQERYPLAGVESMVNAAHAVVERIRAAADAAEATHDVLVDLLHLGAPAFNRWLFTHPQTSLDLARADLSGLHLPAVYLSGADLSGAELTYTDLSGAVLSGADLTDASFLAADLTGAMFGPADLIDASIPTPLQRRIVYGATLKGARFAAATLNHTSFRETPLDGVDLRACDLSTLDLRGTSLKGALVDDGQTGPTGPIEHPPFVATMDRSA